MYRIVTGIILLVVLGSGCKPSTAHSFSLEDEFCEILQAIEKDHPMERDSITGKVFLSRRISFVGASDNFYFLTPSESHIICDSTFMFLPDEVLDGVYGFYSFNFYEPAHGELGLRLAYGCNLLLPIPMCNDYGKAILFKKKKVWEVEKSTYIPIYDIKEDLEYERAPSSLIVRQKE